MSHLITLEAWVLTQKGYKFANEINLQDEIIVYNRKTKMRVISL